MGSERDRRIEERAYEIWLERGRPDGTADHDWAQAAREIAESDAAAHAASPEGASGTDDVKPGKKDKSGGGKSGGGKSGDSGKSGRGEKGTASKSESGGDRKAGGKTRSGAKERGKK